MGFKATKSTEMEVHLNGFEKTLCLENGIGNCPSGHNLNVIVY